MSAMSWWWIAPCAVTLLVAPFVWRPLWRIAGSISLPQTTVAPKPASQLGFSATHEGNDWRLAWSRDALARLEAVGAMLTIRDGGIDRLQFLSPRDLATGAILYVPKTSDLLFNLKVTLPAGNEIEEQVRVLGQEQDAVPELTYSPPPRRIGEAARAVEPSAPTPAPASAPNAGKQPVTMKQFQPPPVPAVQTAAPADVALPEASLPATAAPPLRFTGAAPPPPPAPRPAPVAPAPAPAPPIVAAITRVDPSPLRTVVAQWPRNAARQGAMAVRIRVRIDAQGRVIAATPVERTVANFAFVDSAVSAARMWTFSPATENGRPVPSESVLTFKFTP